MSDAELEAIRARDAYFDESFDATRITVDDYRMGGRDRRTLLARLDAAEARERALRAALIGVAPFTLGLDGTYCYCDEDAEEDDYRHSDACTLARALLAEPPPEGGS